MKKEIHIQDIAFHNGVRSAIDKNKRITDVLNFLIEINNDRIKGYFHALIETDDSYLKVLLNSMAFTSQIIISDLSCEVLKYGGKPTESATISCKASRVRMDFKTAPTPKNRKSILTSCQFREDIVQQSYLKVIKNNSDFPLSIMQFIIAQKENLRKDYNCLIMILEFI